MNKKPFAPGYVEPQTGRVAVLIADYANSDLNGEAPAYWFDPAAATVGLDPWRLVEGVDPHVNSVSMDVWLVAGNSKTVGPLMTFFVAARDAKRLAQQMEGVAK